MNIIVDKFNNNEEFKLLYEKMINGDTKAREEIILRAYPMVIFVLNKKFKGDYHTLEEYKSHGIIGLIKAVDSYKLNKNIKFTTYAIRCIENEIGMYIRKCNNKINSSMCSMYNKNNLYFSVLEKMHSGENIEEDYTDKAQIEDLKIAIDRLSEREKTIIINYFGINNISPETMKEIADKIGITQSGISRSIPVIIKKLKAEMEILGYEEQTYKLYRSIK